MKKILTQYGVCALAAALMVPLALAQAQPAGIQAAFGQRCRNAFRQIHRTHAPAFSLIMSDQG